MSGSEQPQSAQGAGSAPHKSRSRVLLPFLFFFLALTVFAGVVYYLVGVDYVMSLVGMGSMQKSAVVATSTVPVSDAALKLPAGVSADLAKRVYVEQIQSQTNLKKMAAGDIKRFNVTSVKTSKSAAAVFVKASFTDGTSAPGVIQLVKLGQAWYFMSFTGLSSAGIDGLADTVNKGTVAFGLLSDAELVRKSGVKQFDNGVINAILAEQTANQSIMNGILDRSLTVIELGTPAPGAGTTVVPANLSGKSAKPVAGEAVMVNATVGQDDLVFLTSFRTK